MWRLRSVCILCLICPSMWLLAYKPFSTKGPSFYASCGRKVPQVSWFFCTICKCHSWRKLYPFFEIHFLPVWLLTPISNAPEIAGNDLFTLHEGKRHFQAICEFIRNLSRLKSNNNHHNQDRYICGMGCNWQVQVNNSAWDGWRKKFRHIKGHATCSKAGVWAIKLFM